MRWDQLFGDLEAQLEVAAATELADEVADRTRREAGQLRLVDRMLPARGHDVRLRVCGLGEVSGRLRHVGVQAVLVEQPGAREALIPLSAILSVGGLTPHAAVPGASGQVFERLGMSAALRALARDRAGVRVVLSDGATVTGTIDRVGEDFLEVAEHPEGEPRRRDRVTGVRVVPFAALAAILSC